MQEQIDDEMDEETTQQSLELMEVEYKSNSTITQYQRHIKKFTDFYGKNPKQKYIIKYLHYLRKKRNYDKSSLCVVKSALKYYYEQVLNKKITIKLPTIKRRKSIPKPLSREIIKRIINNISNLKHRILVEITYGSGLRLGEVICLKWVDIDFNGRIIEVNRGKGDKDRRVRLSDETFQHLKDYKVMRKNQKCIFIFDSGYNPDTHICERTFQKILKNITKKLGIEVNVHPHKLRHSFATHLLENGEKIEKVQKLLGHNNIKTTMGYTRVTKDVTDIVSPMDDPYFRQKEVKRNYV